jgi:protein-tyrosine phosphatase
MFRNRRVRLAFAATLLGAAVGGGWCVYQHHRYKHFAAHEEGMIYRSAWLGPGVLSELIEEHQLRTIVNLCRPDEMTSDHWSDQRQAVTKAGGRLLTIPMPTSIAPDDPDLEPHLALLQDPDNYPMLVHCQHGVTRTAKFLAIYDIVFRGMTAAESLAAQPLFGRDEHNVNVRAFAREFEARHRNLYESALPEDLSVLRE